MRASKRETGLAPWTEVLCEVGAVVDSAFMKNLTPVCNKRNYLIRLPELAVLVDFEGE